MISSSPRARPARCAVVVGALLLTSCTYGTGGDAAAEHSSSPSPSLSRKATGPSGKTLAEQARAALDTVHSGTMVEGGAEDVTDGIHTEPSLSKGRTYRLSLVCFGIGSARLVFTPAAAGTEAEVPCDRSMVLQRINAVGPLRIDVEGEKGATGVIGWQIDAV